MADDVKYWTSVAAALGVSVVVSGEWSLPQIMTRAACGLFCVLVFTPLACDLLKVETGRHESAVAALLMATGYSLVRFLSSLRPEDIMGWLRKK